MGQERERVFHDDRWASGDRERSATNRIYRLTRESFERTWGSVNRAAQGKDTVELGCGPGDTNTASIAQSYVGIDISPVVIDQARRAHPGIRFEVGEAESMPFKNNSVDLVYGFGVLHHVELDLALAELHRILRTGGMAVFREPMGHNPVINAYRRRTPTMRTPEEHPFTRADLGRIASIFDTQCEYFHLLTLASTVLPFASRPLSAVDRVLLASWSPLRYWAWVVVLVLSKP